MVQETGQLDMPDRQLKDSSSQSGASEWTEIGQVEVVHTIFGKARVRIIRKHDKVRGVIYFLAIGAIAAFAWAGWVLFERSEARQIETYLPQYNSKTDLGAPDSKAENTELSPASLPVKSNAKVEINKPFAGQQNNAEQAQDGNNTDPVNSKPTSHHPISTITPQSAPLATTADLSRNQSDKILLPQQTPKQTISPFQSMTKSPESSSAIIPILPTVKEEVAPQSIGDIQFVTPLNSKP